MSLDEEKRSTIIKRASDLIDTAVSSLKGQDVAGLVETYTDEVTTVLEGMGEDLTALQTRAAEADARLTVLEEALREAQQAHDVLRRDVDALRHQASKQAAKKNRGKSALTLVFLTVSVFSAAWVITAVLKLLA